MGIGLMEDFKDEAIELIEMCESTFIEYIDSNKEEKEKRYNILYSLIHSLTGSAGLIGLNALQRHMKLLEESLCSYPNGTIIPESICQHFLSGLKVARAIIDGNDIDDTYNYTQLLSNKNINDEITNEKIENNISIKQILEEELPIITYSLEEETDHFINKEFTQLNIYKINDYIIEKDLTNLGEPAIFITTPNALENLEKQLSSKTNFHPIIIINDKPYKGYINWQRSYGIEHLKSLIETTYREKMIKFYFQKSMTLLVYQLSDLEGYLKENNKEIILNTIKEELGSLLRVQNEVFKNE